MPNKPGYYKHKLQIGSVKNRGFDDDVLVIKHLKPEHLKHTCT